VEVEAGGVVVVVAGKKKISDDQNVGSILYGL